MRLAAIVRNAVGRHKDSSARHRPGADVNPVRLFSRSPWLKPQRVQAPYLTWLRDLVGHAMHDHAPARERSALDPVDLKRGLSGPHQGVELRPIRGAEHDRLRGLVEGVIDRPDDRRALTKVDRQSAEG